MGANAENRALFCTRHFGKDPRYRVMRRQRREVRNRANAHLSFLGLALNCGFNSKATFNRAFRKFTGTSPGAFSDEQA